MSERIQLITAEHADRQVWSANGLRLGIFRECAVRMASRCCAAGVRPLPSFRWVSGETDMVVVAGFFSIQKSSMTAQAGGENTKSVFLLVSSIWNEIKFDVTRG